MKKIDEKSLENLVTNILSDIDRTLRIKVSDYKLDLSTLTSEEKIINYIEDKKSNIRKSLKEVIYKNRTPINKYAEYLTKKPLKISLRREAINYFIYSSIVLYGKNESAINFMNSYDYKQQRKLDIVKSLVQRASLLEFNSFLSDELNKVIKKENKINKFNIQKTTHPFIDDEMLGTFNYILEKWNYDKDLKYAYIFNELMPEEYSRSEYEKYIRDNYKQIIKFNYNNANSKTIIQNLRQIIKSK